MEKILLESLTKWTGAEIASGDPSSFIIHFSTDTRTIKNGDFFIPLRGENYDGHHYISEAVQKNAGGFVYSHLSEEIEKIIKEHAGMTVLFCSDTFNFLKDAAKNYIRGFKCINIGITGSVGKTTTKNFLVNILKINNNVVFTPKNYNNEIGVPISIFNIDRNTKYFIAELGMRGKGQIAQLSKICNLHYGVITAIGKSHLEYFSSEEDIAKAKSEISVSLAKNHGILFLHDDDKYAAFISKIINCDALMCGLKKGLPYFYSVKEPDRFDRYGFELYESGKFMTDIALKMSGRHAVINAFLAASLALYLKESPENIKKGLEKTACESGRMELIEKGSRLIINDCYNSNPLSVIKAIDSLQRISLKNHLRSVAILGDMFELGNDSLLEHYKIGQYLNEKKIDMLIAFGRDSINTFEAFQKNNENCYYFEEKKEMEDKLQEIIKDNDAVLIKGSRANQMENIYQLI